MLVRILAVAVDRDPVCSDRCSLAVQHLSSMRTYKPYMKKKLNGS
jgi:hypothetical protein